MLAFVQSLIAQSQPTAETTGNWVLVFVAVACPVVSLIFGGLSVWLSSKRNPPIAEEIAKALAQYIPRVEHAEEIQRVHERIDKTADDVNTVRSMLTKAFGDMERALGRLEGRHERAHREHHH